MEMSGFSLPACRVFPRRLLLQLDSWSGFPSGFDSTRFLRRLECYPRANRPRDPGFELVAGDLQIVVSLQVEPPFGPRPEIPGEPQGGVGTDGSLTADDLANPERRHPQGLGEGILRQS